MLRELLASSALLGYAHRTVWVGIFVQLAVTQFASAVVLQNLCQGFPANLKDVMAPLLVPGNSSKAELG